MLKDAVANNEKGGRGGEAAKDKVSNYRRQPKLDQYVTQKRVQAVTSKLQHFCNTHNVCEIFPLSQARVYHAPCFSALRSKRDGEGKGEST
jgi:hypothetical protein